jgi:hypothetical protein
MTSLVELTDAKRARIVWGEAKVPKCGPLGVVAALALGKDLSWAAQWRENASPPLTQQEKALLNQIDGAAAKLTSLLAVDRSTRNNIEIHWPCFYGLRETRLGLVAIRKAARKAQKQPYVAAKVCKASNSPERLFVKVLANVYSKYAGRGAGVSRDNRGEISGPFIRFVQETSRQFCPGMAVPHGNTIRLAIDAMSGTLPRHAEK